MDPIDVTVDQLYDELKENALKASNTYKGKYIRLTGNLMTIDSDGKYFSLEPMNDEWSFNSVNCNIEKKHLDKVCMLT